MGEESISDRRLRAARIVIAVAVLLGFALWLQKATDAAVQRASSRGDGATSVEGAERPAAVLERAADGLPIMSAGLDTKVFEQPMHPHPITPEHERIFRENNLVGALNLAVDRADPLRLREILAEYRTEFPEDSHRLQEGYAIIAACLERLDDATRERARRFWSTEIRSQTRRYVRRYCLPPERAS